MLVAIGIGGERPAGSVGDPVVVAAQQQHLVDVGGAAVLVAGLVVCIAVPGWHVASRKHTAPVPNGKGELLAGSGPPPGAAESER